MLFEKRGDLFGAGLFLFPVDNSRPRRKKMLVIGLILIVLAGLFMSFLFVKKGLLRSKTAWASVVGWVLTIPLFADGQIGIVALVAGLGGLIAVIFLRGEIEQNLQNLLNKFKWWKSGTVWTLVFGTILTNVLAWLNGQMDFKVMALTMVPAIIGIFLRSAVKPETY
jgi:hypothetical protein